MKMLLTIALRNLRQASLRSAFVGTAIALVTMLLVILMAFSAGIRDNLVFAATSISTGHVNVGGFYKASRGDANPIVTDADEVETLIVENIDGIDFVIDRQNGFGKVVSATSSLTTVLSGIDAAQETRFFEAIQLAPESEYREGGSDEILGDPTRLSEPGTALLFAGQAERLGVTVGDSITVKTETLRGVSNTADFTVVAVARDIGLMSNWYTFVNDQSILDLYQLKEGTTGSIRLYLDDIERSQEVVGEVRNLLSENGYEVMDYDPRPYFMKFESVMAEDWTGQRFDVTTWEDEVNYVTWIVTAVDTVTFILIAVLTVIIIIGIMNTMWMSVRERTNEVGTLRAIGMRKGQILALFMLEAMILGFGATCVGALLGAGLAAFFDWVAISVPVDALSIILMSDTINFSVHPSQIVTAVFVFTFVTAFSAIWPSIRASRLQPVSAMHHVD